MKYFKSVIALTAICAAISLLLALTNSITAPIIEKNASAAANSFQDISLLQYVRNPK